MLKTELCLGLPGGAAAGDGEPMKVTGGKRGFSETIDLKLNIQSNQSSPSLENSPMEKNLLPNCPKDPVKPPAK